MFAYYCAALILNILRRTSTVYIISKYSKNLLNYLHVKAQYKYQPGMLGMFDPIDVIAL